ncbi:MAG: quinate 5-dehydrogenase [bacterium]
MKRVVSVSIGSSDRDHTAEVELLGEEFRLERIGTDGDLKKARELIAGLDGSVDAIGIGGLDLYLIAGGRRYVIRDARGLAEAAKRTFVTDGSGLKNTLERAIVRDLAAEGKFLRKGTRVLLTSAVDRFGMAEALHGEGCDVIFGDFLFSLGLNIPLKSPVSLRTAAAVLLPVLTRLPIGMLYPTGKKQKERRPAFGRYFRWAEVIAGDFHFIRRKMPDDITGKVILTNTVTARDVEELRVMGAAALITTTPEFEGRSFGTNVLEGLFAAALGKRKGDGLTETELHELIEKTGLKPRVVEFASG